jgi:hypothetical protein
MKKIALVLAVLFAGFLGGIYSFRPARATRNSAGTYSLATGNPVVTGTTISTTWANNTLSDIATEMTNSLDRNGRGGMLAQFASVDGTQAAPGIAFVNETGTGFYRAGTSDMRMCVNGTPKAGLNSTGFRLIDSSSGANSYGVNLLAPTLAASYSVTMPTAAPASTLPVSMSSAGVLSAGQITAAQVTNNTITATQIANSTLTNATQGFGTPSASTDVAIKSYVDGQFPIGNSKQSFGTPSASTDVAIKSYVDGQSGFARARATLITGGSGTVSVNNSFNFSSASYSSSTLTIITNITLGTYPVIVCNVSRIGSPSLTINSHDVSGSQFQISLSTTWASGDWVFCVIY